MTSLVRFAPTEHEAIRFCTDVVSIRDRRGIGLLQINVLDDKVGVDPKVLQAVAFGPFSAETDLVKSIFIYACQCHLPSPRR